jgi:hypothetical protein
MSQDWYTLQFEVIDNSHSVFFKMRNTQKAGKMFQAFNERNGTNYHTFKVGEYVINPEDIVGDIDLSGKTVTAL